MWACVVAADASIPDNPYGPDQGPAADKANLSDAQCDGVLLDRTAPRSRSASVAAGEVGELVSFAVAGGRRRLRPGSGYEWSFGDNSGGGSGES